MREDSVVHLFVLETLQPGEINVDGKNMCVTTA